MKVRFTRAYKVKDDEGMEYAEGQVVMLPEASAMHFINRNVAVIADEPGVETAAIEQPETAVRARGRPRKVAADATEDDAKRSAE